MSKSLEQVVPIITTSQRILVIDDDNLLRKTIVRLLGRIHDDIVQAANFPEA